mmetsp:Transcript_26441/g.82322  ORF Transcript_26441/g.82322 Transcript_26441/m.82322 type:complete len:101 (-) Transcript_26441:820-1122(-)
MVLPVPGGPWSRMWRNGAAFVLVSLAELAMCLSLVSSLASRITRSRASRIGIGVSSLRAQVTGWITEAGIEVRDVSRTRLGLLSCEATKFPITVALDRAP